MKIDSDREEILNILMILSKIEGISMAMDSHIEKKICGLLDDVVDTLIKKLYEKKI